MSEIVNLHHNEPMTTSLVIADGVEMEHNSVLVLLKKHIESLSEFGRVQFEIEPFETKGGRQWRDVYFLNERQATLLRKFGPCGFEIQMADMKQGGGRLVEFGGVAFETRPFDTTLGDRHV